VPVLSLKVGLCLGFWPFFLPLPLAHLFPFFVLSLVGCCGGGSRSLVSHKQCLNTWVEVGCHGVAHSDGLLPVVEGQEGDAICGLPGNVDEE
jgi:hypothetical protein